MNTTLAIDPGTTESGWVLLGADGVPLEFGKTANEELLEDVIHSRAGELVIEMVASYGMPVGAEVFETCVWIGRFLQAHGGRGRLIYRRDVKLHMCGVTRAKDGNIRQAVIDRFGGKDKAIGKKAAPGPCYGMAGDVWQALALALTAREAS